MKGYVKVLFPVEVPDSIYCWEHSKMDSPICDHFDNEGGHSFCNLFKESLRGHETKEGVTILAQCANLVRAPVPILTKDIEHEAKQQYYEKLRQERDEYNRRYQR